MKRLMLAVSAVLVLLVVLPADAATSLYTAKGVVSVFGTADLPDLPTPHVTFAGTLKKPGLSAQWRFDKSFAGLPLCTLAAGVFKATAYMDWSNGAHSVAKITVLIPGNPVVPSDPYFVWSGTVKQGLFAGKRFAGVLIPTEPIRPADPVIPSDPIHPVCTSKVAGRALIG